MPSETKHSADRLFSKAHLRIAVAVWLVFTLLALIHALENVDQEPDREWTIGLTTLSTPTGPMLGAISRHGESGCLAYSLSLLPVCGSLLALGLIAQWFIPRASTKWRIVRLLLWTGGWLAWFVGGLLSLLNALS